MRAERAVDWDGVRNEPTEGKAFTSSYAKLPSILASSLFHSLFLSNLVNHRLMAYIWSNGVEKHDEAMASGHATNPSRFFYLSTHSPTLIRFRYKQLPPYIR